MSSSPPFDPAMLESWALNYLARYATSTAKLKAYLHRKVLQRGIENASDNVNNVANNFDDLIESVVARCVDAGYVDDRSFADARATSMLRRGYGARRIAATLEQARIDRSIVLACKPSDRAGRYAALAMAKKRHFGPWGEVVLDHATSQRQIASLLRAGHSPQIAKMVVLAPSSEEAEAWADEASAGEEEYGETGGVE